MITHCLGNLLMAAVGLQGRNYVCCWSPSVSGAMAQRKRRRNFPDPEGARPPFFWSYRNFDGARLHGFARVGEMGFQSCCTIFCTASRAFGQQNRRKVLHTEENINLAGMRLDLPGYFAACQGYYARTPLFRSTTDRHTSTPNTIDQSTASPSSASHRTQLPFEH